MSAPTSLRCRRRSRYWQSVCSSRPCCDARQQHPFFLQHITENLSVHITERVSLPFTATCYLLIFVAALFVAHYTRFGRYIYALGGDEQSATLMGLPVGRTQIFTYTVSGFCSALAGVVYTFYT